MLVQLKIVLSGADVNLSESNSAVAACWWINFYVMKIQEAIYFNEALKDFVCANLSCESKNL